MARLASASIEDKQRFVGKFLEERVLHWW